MPPGEVPSTRVTQCSPVAHDSAHANRPHTSISPTVPTAIEPSQRGAVRKKSARKRTPRLTPITNCAAFTSTWGTAESVTPNMAIPIETTNAPMNHGLARPSRRITSAPAPVAAASSARPGPSTTRTAAGNWSMPCSPLNCSANGIVTVTITRRRLWLAATRSVRAFSRSDSSVISDAAPMAPEK